MKEQDQIKAGISDSAKPENKQNNKMTPKRIAALLIVILLVLLYLITLIAAIIDPSASGKLFGLCLFATVTIPLLSWVYIWMYGKLTGKRTMADPPEKPSSEEPSSGRH